MQGIVGFVLYLTENWHDKIHTSNIFPVRQLHFYNHGSIFSDDFRFLKTCVSAETMMATFIAETMLLKF